MSSRIDLRGTTANFSKEILRETTADIVPEIPFSERKGLPDKNVCLSVQLIRKQDLVSR